MSANMVERVARVLAADAGYVGDDAWKTRTDQARLVIEALRELSTDEQVTLGNALRGQIESFPETPMEVLARHAWHSMIDAVLRK